MLSQLVLLGKYGVAGLLSFHNAENNHMAAHNNANNDLEHCSYAFHENGIHEFIINRPTPRAVDDLIGHIKTRLNDIPSHQTVRELVNFSVGVPPIAYMARRGRETMVSTGSPKLRVAFLYEQSTTMAILKTLVDLVQIGAVQVKAFRARQRAEAIEWLLKDGR